MEWYTSNLADIMKNSIGIDVLIMLRDGQYMAGTFHRTADKKVQFVSSDGVWTARAEEISKFCIIV